MKYHLSNDYDVLKAMFPTVSELFNLEVLNALALGKTELSNEEFCIKTEYNMRKLDEQFFESHLKYIDIHITLEGSELFAVSPVANLDVTASYDSTGDCVIYSKNCACKKLVSSKPLDVLVFGPDDGHMTAIGDVADSVKKVIVKVLIENTCN